MKRRLFVIVAATAVLCVVYLATFPGPAERVRSFIKPHVPGRLRHPVSRTIASAKRESGFLYGFLLSKFASDRSAAGEAEFQLSCSSCHGLEQADAALLARQNFAKHGDFETARLILAESTPGDMPTYSEQLSSREVFNIVAYLRSLETLPLTAVRKRPAAVLDGAYKYVALDGAIRVYDLGREYAMVKQVRVKNMVNARGIAASSQTGLLYVSFEGRHDSPGGWLACIDLATDETRWVREYLSGIDSMALSPDGAKIYMPSGETQRDRGEWIILDALTGEERNRVAFGIGAHNTVVSPDGKFVYLDAVASNYLGVLDTSTEQIVGQIGPFGSNVRPFALTADGSYALVNLDFLSGFEVADLRSGKVIHRVEVEGFPWQNPKLPGPAQSHGVSLSPDEAEAWVSDAWNRYVHIFDVSDLPNKPRQIASIDVARDQDGPFLPKWINFSRDGRYAHISNGAIIDAKSRQIIKWIPEARNFLEIHFQQGKPVAAFPRYGVGYAGPAWWSNDNELAAQELTSRLGQKDR